MPGHGQNLMTGAYGGAVTKSDEDAVKLRAGAGKAHVDPNGKGRGIPAGMCDPNWRMSPEARAELEKNRIAWAQRKEAEKSKQQNPTTTTETQMAVRKKATAKKAASTKPKAKVRSATKTASTNGEKPPAKTVEILVPLEVSAVIADSVKVEKLEVEVSGTPTRRPPPVIGAAHLSADYSKPENKDAESVTTSTPKVSVIDDTELAGVLSELSQLQVDLETKRKARKPVPSSLLQNLLKTTIGGSLLALISGLVGINLVTLGVMVDFPVLLPALVSTLAAFASVSSLRSVVGKQGISVRHLIPGLFLLGIALVTIVHTLYKHPAFGWMSL